MILFLVIVPYSGVKREKDRAIVWSLSGNLLTTTKNRKEKRWPRKGYYYWSKYARPGWMGMWIF
jgi:hypothetical protein